MHTLLFGNALGQFIGSHLSLCLEFWFYGVDSFISWAVTSQQLHRIITFANSTGLYNEEKIAVPHKDFTSFFTDPLWWVWLFNLQAFRTLTEGYHKTAGVVCERQSNPSLSQTVPRGREEALPHTKNVCAWETHSSSVCEGAERDWEQTDMKDNSRSDVTNTRHKGVDPSLCTPLSHMPKSNPLHHLHPDPAVWSSHP